ncbi:MAG: peptidoglycan DD-metalloendopeptidase family protein [Rickettsiales bacterium]|jgi:murein DD-endopeptidase MepM/ murein hydrolase activator NlpD|nr:peptidoglycan DD-metalloendopeptidase family protein [Rickettsiales bacterium]
MKKAIIFTTLAAAMSITAAALFMDKKTALPEITQITHHPVRAGDTLSAILAPHGFSGQDILDIAKLLKKEAGIHGLKADGDIVKIETGENDRKISIQSGPWNKIDFEKNGDGWICRPTVIEKTVSTVLRSGEIADGDSFYAAGIRAKIPESVLADAYDLLAFEMDFERDMRAGQQFRVLYEENFADKFVNTGNILALFFDAGRRGVIKMYRFQRSDGRGGYYDERGGGAIKSLKRTPINNARITSSFSGKRKHPVLGYSRAHRGVDFRAGTGTPIPSAGAGRVAARGTNAGYGKFIRIRHNATYETLYAHMSRFQRGVGVGTHVKQGQTVGYVGSTGISTGPHLHYEIIKSGTRVNPMTVKLPAIDSLPERDREKFQTLRKSLDKTISAAIESCPVE